LYNPVRLGDVGVQVYAGLSEGSTAVKETAESRESTVESAVASKGTVAAEGSGKTAVQSCHTQVVIIIIEAGEATDDCWILV